MTDTTIAVSDRVKALIDDEKLEGETYNATLLRLLDAQEGSVWTEQEIEDIALRAVERELQGRFR